MSMFTLKEILQDVQDRQMSVGAAEMLIKCEFLTKKIDLKDYTKEELIDLKNKIYKAILDFKNVKVEKTHIPAFQRGAQSEHKTKHR